LLLLCNRYAGAHSPGAIRLAAVVELLHSATLIHDDVIDSANTRRGRPSANSKWGNHRSVLAGDWLYMQSFQMALEERNFRILDVLIDLTQKMVEGELIQLEKIGRIDVTEDDALRLATYKPASRVKKKKPSPTMAAMPAWRFNWWMTCWTSRLPPSSSASRCLAI
jgi:octaprenyl-diphosphate synthase